MQVRRAAPSDADSIRAIYNAEVSGGTNTFDLVPRTRADQAAWLLRHQGAHPAVVAVDDPGTVVGFGSLSPFRSRPAYATSVESSVYVDAAHRRRGVGHLLLEELLVLAAAHGFHTVIARIVGHNEGSITLHERSGFTLVGVEHEIGRKHRTWLDVVELQRML